jgi:hypothetical protein
MKITGLTLHFRIEKTDSPYTLESNYNLLRITKRGELIHVQDNELETPWGLKKLEDILKNIEEYVLFVEEHRPFDHAIFPTEEHNGWADIRIQTTFITPSGEKTVIGREFRTIHGRDRGLNAYWETQDYLKWIYGVKTNEEVEQIMRKYSLNWSMEELINHLNNKE